MKQASANMPDWRKGRLCGAGLWVGQPWVWTGGLNDLLLSPRALALPA